MLGESKPLRTKDGMIAAANMAFAPPPSLSSINIDSAAVRIAPYVRLTPVMNVGYMRSPLTDAQLWLKLENHQVTGSFKVRGAMNFVLTQAPEKIRKGLVTASGGNHGLAVAYASKIAKTSATVFVSTAVPEQRVEKLRSWGAIVHVSGNNYDETLLIAQEYASQSGGCYIHGFADPAVIAGQGTLGLELLDQLPQLDCVIVAIGGGGLIGGIAQIIKTRRPKCRVIGVEADGAAKMSLALRAGHVVSLAEVTTKAVSIAQRMTTELNLDLVRRYVDDIITVSDEDMMQAIRWLWNECNVSAEMAGAAGVAALQTGALKAKEGETVCSLICGADVRSA